LTIFLIAEQFTNTLKLSLIFFFFSNQQCEGRYFFLEGKKEENNFHQRYSLFAVRLTEKISASCLTF